MRHAIQTMVSLPSKVWSRVRPVHVDGFLYFCIAFFGSLLVSLGSDAAYKYIEPFALFKYKMWCGAIAAGATALKTFRSTAYADRLRQDKEGQNKG